MILAFDTYYFDNKAKTVCIGFSNWEATTAQFVVDEITEGVEDYIPGEFYKRELPCISSLYDKIPATPVETIVIDGFVVLDDNGRPGLGAHLYNHLQGKIPVIGVAKNDFSGISVLKKALYRGDSNKPLLVTAIGIALDDAFENVSKMSGEFRIPTLLKQLDQLSKH